MTLVKQTAHGMCLGASILSFLVIGQAYLWWHKVSRQLGIENPTNLEQFSLEHLTALEFEKRGIKSWRQVCDSKVQ